MTRKRYIKLLMSRGFSRNRAQDDAITVALNSKSYQHIWNVCYKEPEEIVITEEEMLKVIKENLINIQGLDGTVYEQDEDKRGWRPRKSRKVMSRNERLL